MQEERINKRIKLLNDIINGSWEEVSQKDAKILLDYITNLQEENASKDYTIKEFMRANNQLQVEKEQLNSLVNSCQKEIRKIKELCDKYEEEHKTTFEEWKKDINIIDELEKFLDGKYNEWKDSENENIRESAYEDLRILEYLKELKGDNK